MGEFLGYTVGLECNGHKKVGKLLKVEFSRENSEIIRMTAVSGHNLSSTNVSRFVTNEEFDSRPTRDKIKEAKWALRWLGFELMAEDFCHEG